MVPFLSFQTHLRFQMPKLPSLFEPYNNLHQDGASDVPHDKRCCTTYFCLSALLVSLIIIRQKQSFFERQLVSQHLNRGIFHQLTSSFSITEPSSVSCSRTALDELKGVIEELFEQIFSGVLCFYSCAISCSNIIERDNKTGADLVSFSNRFRKPYSGPAIFVGCQEFNARGFQRSLNVENRAVLEILPSLQANNCVG